MENETNYSNENEGTMKPSNLAYNQIYLEFMSLFNCNSKEELLTYLREKNVSSKQVCAKVLEKGVGAWICKDCEKDTSCIICNECYEKSKEKHITHKKYFKSHVSGCCDCGDPDSWDPDGFCSDHSGIITSEKETQELINKTFDAHTLLKIYSVLEKLFKLLSSTIDIYELTDESLSTDWICKALEYFDLMATANSAFLHIIVFFFSKNFPYNTTHQCFILEDEYKIITKSETDSSHACKCSFFQNLLRIWDKNFDEKMKIDKVLFTFLKSYKFKYLFGFSYFSIYDTIMINDATHLKSFSVQIMTIENIAEKIVSSEEFVTSLFEKFYFLMNYFLNGEKENMTKNYENLFKIVYEFFNDINFLSKPRPAKILSKYVNILKILIDAIAVVHNRTKFETVTSFQNEGYQEHLHLLELYLLHLFSLLTTNFDFSINKNADEVLFYLMDKIRTKNYSFLSDNQYTFHIPLNRALAIFLNRYAFNESMSQNIDVFMAVKIILYKYYDQTSLKNPNYSFENLLSDMTHETIKFVGFLNSVQCKYWKYYGEEMLYYYIFYYVYDTCYLADFSLLKIFLSQDHKSELTNLPYFLKVCDVNESYKVFMKELFENGQYVDVPGKILFMKNLDFFIRIFRNNSYILDLLANSYDRIKSSKMEDTLLINLISNEKQNFNEFVKIRLIHNILSKENSIYFSEIQKSLPFYIKELMDQEKIERLLGEMCDKITLKNKPISFSLKNEYVKKSDLFYIIDPKNEVHAEKYFIDFKKKEVCLLNTPEMTSFTFLKIMGSNFANHFFQNENNMNICVKTTVYFLDKISNGEISPNLNIILDFMKFIDIFVEMSHKNAYLLKWEDKITTQSLLNCLRNVKISDENLQLCCKYLHERILTLCPVDMVNTNPVNNTKDNEAELKKLKMKELKEKTAAMFKNKSNMFKKNIGIFAEENVVINADNNLLINLTTDKMIIDNTMSLEEEPHNTTHDCIICRNKINSREFFQNPYGRLGIFSSSSFLYHSKLQTLKKEYEKLILKKKSNENSNSMTCEVEEENTNVHLMNPEEQLFAKDLMLTYKRSKPEMKKSIRFASCDHYIHFSCYLEFIIKYVVGSLDSSKLLIFICPLCKTTTNTFIPNFDFNNLLKSEDSANILKALTFEELFLFYKEVLSQNTNINQTNLNLFSIKNKKIQVKDNVMDCASYYVEKIVSLQTTNSFLISDFKNSNQQKYYDAIKFFFVNSLNLLDILRNDDYSKTLDLLKEYILSLRLLIKTNQLDGQIFFNRLLQIQFYWNTSFCNEELFSYNIDTDKVSAMFFENLFLILLLFEESELNYLNLIFRNFIPLIVIQFFVTQMYINYSFKMKLDQFEKSFVIDNLMYILISPEHNSSIKKLLLFYLRKALLLKNIFKENRRIKNNFLNVDEELIYYCEELGITIGKDLQMTDFLQVDESTYPSFWTFRQNIKELTIKLFEKYFISKSKVLKSTEESYSNFDTINPSLLLMTNDLRFNFISIPNNLLDLSQKYYEVICNNCGTNPAFSILCLVCGEKVCYTESCCKNFGKNKNTYEYIHHNKICGSGDGVYLHLYNGEITLALLGNFVNPKMSLYINKYRESVKGKSISDEFVLNEEFYTNLLNEFNNFSYQKYFRISQGSFAVVEEEEDM